MFTPLRLKTGLCAVANGCMSKHTPLHATAQRLARILAATSVLLLPAGVQAGSIYKCLDLDGRTTYSSLPCGELELTDEVIKDRERSAQHTPRYRAPSGNPSPAIPEFGEARPVPKEDAAQRPDRTPEVPLGPST